jgi:2-polyprenyl-6-methoxyphenol hydroxylase-like FAD-dependent oxidoreductase
MSQYVQWNLDLDPNAYNYPTNLRKDQPVDRTVDVFIIGGGAAGLYLSLYLLRNFENYKLRVTVVEPRTLDRDMKDYANDLKVGESTVDIRFAVFLFFFSSPPFYFLLSFHRFLISTFPSFPPPPSGGLFLARELGLQDYLIENQAPKFGLQYHWSKRGKTATMHDYYSLWALNNPPLQSFQLNRVKLERDLTQMVTKRGIQVLHGKVSDILLTKGEDPHIIEVELSETGKKVIFSSRFVFDCSGRNFVISRRINNVVRVRKKKHILFFNFVRFFLFG